MPKSPKKIGKLALRQNILDGLRDAVILVNGRFEIVDSNLSARELIASNGKSSVLIQEALPLAAVRDTLEKALSGETVEPQEISLPDAGGKIFEIAAKSLPSGAVKKPSWVILTLHDITEVRRNEKAKTEFIANLSHELRSPLTTLTGLIDTLQGPAKNDPEACTHFLGIMEAEATRMRRLLTDLLSLSRLSTGEQSDPLGEVSVTELLQEVASRLALRAQETRMEIQLTCGEETPLPVTGDYDKLMQVFDNLIGNALNYGLKDTPITVTIKKPDPMLDGECFGASVAVTNSGPGISPEHINRLTERFYRIDKARSRAAGGSGLGLTIVEQILNRHRGRLTVSSIEGGLTTFTVYLRNSPSIEKQLQ